MPEVKDKIKSALRHLTIFRDFFEFRAVYGECTNFRKFLTYRWHPQFKNNIYWPVSPRSEVRGRVLLGKGARAAHRPGCVVQGRGAVFIGDYVEMGPNSVIISGNHGLLDHNDVVRKETIIGDYCWIASNAVILAGVVLGPRTIVGAGSVVTKSFPQGYCVIAGNPARVINELPHDRFVKYHHEVEYYGYIRADRFKKFKDTHLSHITFAYDLSKVTENKIFWNKIKND